MGVWTWGFWQAGRKGTGFLRAEDLNDLQSDEEEEENAEKAEKKACPQLLCALVRLLFCILV